MSEIPATTGDDILIGTSGADLVNAGYGSDTIDTGGGDDAIVDLGWLSNTINSGDGNDRISLELQFGSSVFSGYRATSLINAGSGDDLVRYDTGMLGQASIDLGAGNDAIILGEHYFLYNHTVALTLGAGTDRIVLGEVLGDILRSSFDVQPIVVSDFVAGAGGDVIDLGPMMIGWRESDTPLDQFTGGNPFASGHLLLVQDGADTIVRLDYDGSGPGTVPTYLRDLLRLSNVSAASLTAANFGGFDPSGAANAATTVTGTAGIDLLFAAATGSTVNASGGNDEVYGSVSNDTVNGGIGNDRIDGGFGNDQLSGDDGDDQVEGGRGNDTITGGGGNDVLRDTGGGNDSLSGGLGDDVIDIVRPTVSSYDPYFPSTVTLDGGDGHDRVSITVNRFGGIGTRSVQTSFTTDLGAGNDYIYIANGRSTGTLTLGAGQDRVELGYNFTFNLFDDFVLVDPVELTITDFTAGAGGDVIDLNQFMLIFPESATLGFNPFTSGHVQLIAAGSDTVVAIDYDGEGGNDRVDRLILLEGVAIASLTAENFAGYSPVGAALTGVVLTGTAQADTLWGTSGNDTLNGGNGDDRLEGGRGNDLIDGGAGNDQIYAMRGDSQLIGGIGDDLIVSSESGSDTLDGGDGNDRLVVEHRYASGPEAISVIGGTGNDLVDLLVVQAAGATLDVNLGGGADQVIFRNALEVGATLTLGADSDRITLDQDLVSQVMFTITVTDFQTGAGGDVFDWVQYIRQLRPSSDFYLFFDEDGSTPFNPFADGRAQLVQSGADVHLQVAPYAVGYGFETLAVFQNTTVGAFTAHNLGFDPLNSTVATTAGDDVFAGTAGADVAYGGAGNDQLTGLDGNDLLDGGEGNDTLSGGGGNDYLRGGNGTNTITGGIGDDRIEAAQGTDQIDGGEGNDRIVMSGSDHVLGGAGDDQILVRFAWSTGATGGSIDAGDGNDQVVLFYTADLRAEGGVFAVNLGAGNDHLIADGSVGSITLGLGEDLVEFRFGAGNPAELTVNDFQTGNSGDVFALDALLFNSLGIDPFAAGAVELVQVGTTVELRTTALSGFVGAYSPFTIHFLNTNLAEFTAHNLQG